MENQVLEVQKRRLESTLVTCGKVTAVFAVWTIIKTVLTIYFSYTKMGGDARLTKLLSDMSEEMSAGIIKIILAVVIFFIVVLMLLFIIVSIKAVKEGRGRKTSAAYVVLACILVVLSLAGDIYALTILSGSELVGNLIIVIVDLTSNLSLVIIIAASIKLRLLKQAARKEAQQ